MRIWNDPGFEPEVGSLATFPIYEIWSQSVCKFYEVSCKSLNIFANYSFTIKITNKHDVALKYTCMGLHSYNRLCNINPKAKGLRHFKVDPITKNYSEFSYLSGYLWGKQQKIWNIWDYFIIKKTTTENMALGQEFVQGDLNFFLGALHPFCSQKPLENIDLINLWYSILIFSAFFAYLKWHGQGLFKNVLFFNFWTNFFWQTFLLYNWILR